jgi:peptide/nickel transport system substrate-binding protein
MLQKIRRNTLLLLVVMISIVMIGSVTNAQDEKVLVVGVNINIDYMDPAQSFSFSGGLIQRSVYNRLLYFPTDGVDPLQPDLATSWEASADGLSYTFKIRDDVTFSNGDPLKASDVVFSLTRFKNIKGNGAFLADTIDNIEALDDYTVRINLNAPDPAILAKITNGGLSVVNEKVVRENGGNDDENADETDTAEQFFQQSSAGSGPYILTSYEQDVQIVLERNENYWGEPPYFDKVIFSHIPESATQKVALESGDIDIALDVSPDQIPALESDPDIIVGQSASSSIHYIAMNRDPEIGGPLADPTVDLAIRYALDYEGIRFLNSPNSATPAAMVPIGFFGALPPDQGFTRDVDKAKELLSEAGFADGFDAEMLYWSSSEGGVDRDATAQKIQSDLAEIGINLTLVPVGDVNSWLDPYRAGTLQMTMATWGPDFPDPANYLHFVPAPEGQKLVSNRINWTEANADPEILALRDAAAVEVDPVKRAEDYVGIQKYEQEKGPWVPFLQPVQQIAYRSNIVQSDGPVMHPYTGVMDVRLLSRSN